MRTPKRAARPGVPSQRPRGPGFPLPPRCGAPETPQRPEGPPKSFGDPQKAADTPTRPAGPPRGLRAAARPAPPPTATSRLGRSPPRQGPALLAAAPPPPPGRYRRCWPRARCCRRRRGLCALRAARESFIQTRKRGGRGRGPAAILAASRRHLGKGEGAPIGCAGGGAAILGVAPPSPARLSWVRPPFWEWRAPARLLFLTC